MLTIYFNLGHHLEEDGKWPDKPPIMLSLSSYISKVQPELWRTKGKILGYSSINYSPPKPFQRVLNQQYLTLDRKRIPLKKLLYLHVGREDFGLGDQYHLDVMPQNKEFNSAVNTAKIYPRNRTSDNLL